MSDNILHLVSDHSLPAADGKELAEWLREQADEIEAGDFPHLERLFLIWYEPTVPDNESTFSMNSSGTKKANQAEAIGLLEIMLFRLKERIR